MSNPSTPRARPARDWWVITGMTVTALSAAVSSFSGLRSLAVATGWPEALSPLFPLTVDAYAMTATRVWLSGTTRSVQARRFARWNALIAIGLSLMGNATWHLIDAHVLTITWVIVVLVAAVPPAVLGLLSHLAVLRGQDDAGPTSPSHIAEPPHQAVVADLAVPARPDQNEHQQRRKNDEADGQDEPASGLDLFDAARAADAAYRARYGKPITRDALRKTLRVSTERATHLLRELKNHGQ